MGKNLKGLLLFTSVIALAGCASLGGSDNRTQANTNNATEDTNVPTFETLYSGASGLNLGKHPPKDTSSDANRGRLNLYARTTCRFADETMEAYLKSVDPNFKPKGEKEIGSYVAGQAAGLLVNGLSSFLNAAGSDRVDETPVTTSFVFQPGISPVCFELNKNSAGSGRYIFEFGLDHSQDGKFARIIPLYFHYDEKSKNYLLNRGPRVLAVKFAVQRVDETTAKEYVMNLGKWEEGDYGYFNPHFLTADDELNVNLAGPWMPFGTGENVGVNLTATVIETTSGNKIAKYLGAELDENKAKVTAYIQGRIAPPDVDVIADLDKFNTEWVTEYCDRAKTVITDMKSSGVLKRSLVSDLDLRHKVLKQKYTGNIPEGGSEGLLEFENLLTRFIDENQAPYTSQRIKDEATETLEELELECPISTSG